MPNNALLGNQKSVDTRLEIFGVESLYKDPGLIKPTGMQLAPQTVKVKAKWASRYLIETLNGERWISPRYTALFEVKEARHDKEYAVLNYQGHAYVPVRFIAEWLGAFVDYTDQGTYKDITINHFPSNIPILKDDKYANIHFGLLDLYLDGGYTGIRGLLALDHDKDSITEHEIEFKLHFYDENNKVIGIASGTSKPSSSAQKMTISTGEIKYVSAGEVGDFSKYKKVDFEVTGYK